jgi:branched-subunit amino acid transport protein
MSWTLIVALGLGCYLFKVLGLVVIGARSLPPVVERCLALIPAALLSALIVKDVFSVGQELVIDARAAGAAVAVVATWRRAPIPVVIVVASAATAFVRAVS